MRKSIFIFALLSCSFVHGQTFIRSELPTVLASPWEITYGPDDYLWLTEFGGQVSRINPVTGDRQIVFVASDYFPGDPSEDLLSCNKKIGSGTLGLALHPDFLNPDSSFIYFFHSYNSDPLGSPATKFKIVRLKWDASTTSVIDSTNLVVNLPASYDHHGGRLMAIKEDQRSFLFLSIGDHGLSETNDPSCYADQSLNPNNFTQDPSTANGKIHRYNIDGTIPYDNPIPNNSFFTRGHRNPQGLMYNSNLKQLYCVEHGDRTDDEINRLFKGMNYGWKDVRGYHSDGNHPGETAYIANYVPNSQIQNDSLVPAFYSWCDEIMDTSSTNSSWCTVAPSDGIYYCSMGIPEWHNSLLVVTLKDGTGTDKELYQFKLNADGTLKTSTSSDPNPQRFFGDDQDLNGRLRDLCFSPDGTTLYLINNGGAPTSKITKYTVVPTTTESTSCLQITPNPASNSLHVAALDELNRIASIHIISATGALVEIEYEKSCLLNIDFLAAGTYTLRVAHEDGTCSGKFVKL